jgi:calcineurin-like phosphoesterase family protein
MGEVYVISDLHLGHLNMALKRGFSSVEEHDQYIIDQWNKVVKKRDTVYILGDITMEKTASYHLLDKLLGIKKVALGNHDKPQHVPELLKYVSSVFGSFKYKGCILTHIPIHECEIDRFRYCIHGHVHEKSLSDPRYKNVSAEVLEYTPILISELLK